MTTPEKFLAKHKDSIVACLACFDRVIFKGYLPFGDDRHLNSFVDWHLKIPRKNFIPMVQTLSQQLVEHARKTAEAQGAEYRYFQGKVNKEKLIDRIARERGHPDGLLAVLCVQETCRTVKLYYAEKRPWLRFTKRPQRVLYWYFLDPVFGRVYVRIQTWFPFTIQIYINGHEWLARQMVQSPVGFEQRDNCFTELENPEQAQELADRFIRIPWLRQLSAWARIVNPLLQTPFLRGCTYYWVIDQAEYSLDLIFHNREACERLFLRLLDHAALHFAAQDILSFLGRRLYTQFDGEVITECKKDRWPGARIKHRVKRNWLKMYSKFGIVLRIETVINQPREFKVRRWRIRQGQRQLVWCPMNKGVANFYQYHAAAHAANIRYLEALSVVDDPGVSYREIEALAQPRVVGQRSHAPFNPARRKDVELFQAVLHGEHEIRGFRNADIRRILHPQSVAHDQCRRLAAAIGRKLKRLHVRGLIRKIPRTRRWLVTQEGHRVLGIAVRLFHRGLLAA